MTAKQIKNYEIGHHCFGDILRINGVDFDDISNEEIVELINDMIKNDYNNISLLRELLQTTLEYLQFELVDSNYSTCDQCGDWNDYAKYELDDE